LWRQLWTDCPVLAVDESEAVCGGCSENFCLNGGTCVSSPSGPTCSCPDKYKQYYRCSPGDQSAPSSSAVNAPQRPNKTVIAVSVSMSVLVVGIALVIAYIVFKRRQSADSKLGQGMENPVYDMQMGDFSGSAPFTDVAADSKGMENPLYGDDITA